MRKNLRIFGLILIIIGGISSLFFLGVLLHVLPFSITETSCSSQGVWVKFYFNDEPSIPQCFIGSIACTAKTPKGNIVQMGGYTATADSTQKINCPPYTGKSFVGGYLPNEGQGGDYTITCTGRDDSTGRTFTATDTVFASCPTYNSKCADGTPINSCSTNKPYYCDKYGYLIQKPATCGCPEGTVYNSLDKVCEVPQKPPQDICANQPTSCPAGQHISKDNNGCNICVMDPIEDPKPNTQNNTQTTQNNTQTTQNNTQTTQDGAATIEDTFSSFINGLSQTEKVVYSVLSVFMLLAGVYLYRR